MLARFISGVVAAVILIAVLLCDVWVIGICAALLSVWCLMEAFHVFSYHKNPAFLLIGLLCCGAAPFLEHWEFTQITGFLFIILMVLAAAMVICPKKIRFLDLAIVLFLSMVIPVSFSMLMFLRKIPTFGVYYVWLPFLGAFLSDIGAFFVGRAVGGPKLCPELSPKKTVSGSVGGLLGAVVGFFVYAFVLKFVFSVSVNPVPYYLLAIFASLAGQIGDLTMSSVKRYTNVKDFGNVMPGHGGMLDRLDSVIFSGPMVYIFIVTLGLQIMR